MERKILQYLVASESGGKNLSEISIGIGERGDKGRQKVGRCCRKLEANGYIYKENKLAKYHIAEKVYGYPGLTAFSFGIKSVRTVCNIRTWLVSPPEEFHINDFCKNLLHKNDRDYVLQAERERQMQRDQLTLLEFAARIGALIEYIMIQALGPKKALPTRKGFVELDTSVIGTSKDNITSEWLENAIANINIKGIFDEFCHLPIVKRGLDIFADKGKDGHINPSLTPIIQKQLIEKRNKMRKMDVSNQYWSAHDMDEENFEKLVIAFANAFPEIYEKLEKLRKDLPEEIESNIKMAKEEKARVMRLEKEDPHHTKCNGELVPETRYRCKKCGRSLLKR
jgi:hypothetical protein